MAGGGDRGSALITLEHIEVVSGVNHKGEGFCTVSAVGDDRTLMVGQLPPQAVRYMALQWLESAEAAEQDAAVFRVLQRLELPSELAAMVITELREGREA